MMVLESFSRLAEQRNKIKGGLALVPTMGALHAGHVALVRAAKNHAENVMVSIFVNPTQFGEGEDFTKYPRMVEEDKKILEGLADYIYLPQEKDIYPNGAKIILRAGENAQGLDGDFRPGHFDGVVTVVSKLFEQVRPDIALFGEKDFQQLMVIREMNYPGVEIIGVPTIREPDALAMSSRNMYLSAEERKIAPLLYKIISSPYDLQLMTYDLQKAGFKVEYIEQRWGRLLAAAYLGKTRLIDNVPLAN